MKNPALQFLTETFGTSIEFALVEDADCSTLFKADIAPKVFQWVSLLQAKNLMPSPSRKDPRVVIFAGEVSFPGREVVWNCRAELMEDNVRVTCTGIDYYTDRSGRLTFASEAALREYLTTSRLDKLIEAIYRNEMRDAAIQSETSG